MFNQHWYVRIRKKSFVYYVKRCFAVTPELALEDAAPILGGPVPLPNDSTLIYYPYGKSPARVTKSWKMGCDNNSIITKHRMIQKS